MLYGSRARGAETAESDYDVVGIRASGKRTRFAKKVKGAYWDLLVVPEAELKKIGKQHLDWRNAIVLFEKGKYGQQLVRRIQAQVAKPFVPEAQFEIDVTLAWAEKQLSRIEVGDVHGNFRRFELQNAAIEHYFQIRKIQYWGPKAGLQWLKENDPISFRQFAQSYRDPANSKFLKALVKRVYRP